MVGDVDDTLPEHELSNERCGDEGSHSAHQELGQLLAETRVWAIRSRDFCLIHVSAVSCVGILSWRTRALSSLGTSTLVTRGLLVARPSSSIEKRSSASFSPERSPV